MISKLRSDAIAGFSVFLLALPLCLGIAMASDFPPTAGVMSAIIGGMIASFFGGARLSIKGPAAGLIIITLGAVHELGNGDLQLGYERALAVGVIAALIQILIALARKAVVAEVMPPSVIHGMLAAIGVIIISKQSYVAMGLTPHGSEPLELLAALPADALHLNPIIFGLALCAFVIVSMWPLLKQLAFIPPSVVILAIVIPLSLYLDLSTPRDYVFMGNSYELGPRFLINLPEHFFDAISLPDFSVILTAASIKYIIMFAMVGSVESLLTVCAIDSMARNTASSDLNKDLLAVGVGNLVSAFIGGLPMISEIVRSKANIDYGATSARANFFHGLFMLIAAVLLPNIMNLIPLSALAAILVFVGMKLASPQDFIHAYKVGMDQFVIFLTTFFVTLIVDLLAGVATGIVFKLIIHVVRTTNLSQLFSPSITVQNLANATHIQVEGPLVFISYLRLKQQIAKVVQQQRDNNKVVVNLSKVTYLDHTVLKKLQTLQQEFSTLDIVIEDNKDLVQFYNHPLSVRRI